MKLAYSDDRTKLYWGDVLECVKKVDLSQVQAVITSPTYWGKRSFTKEEAEFGGESLEEYVSRNVLLYSTLLGSMKKGGSLFIVIQDSYMGSGISRSHHNHWENNKDKSYKRDGIDSEKQGNISAVTAHHRTIRNKSLCGLPYRIAIALVDMGFLWREQIIWEKPNPMPENIDDRVRQSAEYILHFTNSGKYKFNPKAVAVKTQAGGLRMPNQVWVHSPEPKKGHTATFPSKLVEKLLLAVTDEGDVVFEPFLGSGTMLDLSIKHDRRFIGCDICKDFVDLAAARCKQRKKASR